MIWPKKGAVYIATIKSTKSFNESTSQRTILLHARWFWVIRYDQRSDGIVRVNVEEQNINEMDIIKWTFE